MFGFAKHEKLAKTIDTFMSALANAQGLEASLAGAALPEIDRIVILGLLWEVAQRCGAMHGYNANVVMKALKMRCDNNWGGAADFEWLVANQSAHEIAPWAGLLDTAIREIAAGKDSFGALKPVVRNLRESATPTAATDWILVNQFGESKVFLDRESINKKGSLAIVDVMYDLKPSGKDQRNNKPVKKMFMREEYDLSIGAFRVHTIKFIYDDGNSSDPLVTTPEWHEASGGNAKTLALLQSLAFA